MIERVPKKEIKIRVTNFEGFVSGDFECFCLSRIPFEDWSKKERSYEEDEVLLKYPNSFFPEGCNEGKWKFTITVKAENIEP